MSLNIKVPGGWATGSPYVKVSGAWKPGVVFVKTPSSGDITPIPSGATFGIHCDTDAIDFIGSVSPSSITATIDTVNKKFGAGSLAFDGSKDVQYADSALWAFGSSDFYVETWFKRNTLGTFNYLFGQGNSTGSTSGSAFYGAVGADNVISGAVCIGSTLRYAVAGAVSDLNWHHFKYGRAGGNLIAALDGIIGTPVAVSGTVNDVAQVFALGRFGAYASDKLNGNLDELLIVREPMNTSNFTPPTFPYGKGPWKTV